MWRSAVLEGAHQLAEALVHLCLAISEHGEYPLLQRAVVDSDTAASKFGAVAHQVVAVCENLAGVRLDVLLQSRLGRRERVMRRVPTPLPLVILEQWEIHYERKGYLVRVGELQPLSDLVAQRAQRGVGRLLRSGDYQYHVANLGVHAPGDVAHLIHAQEARRGGAYAVLSQVVHRAWLSLEGDSYQPGRASISNEAD